MTQIHHLFQLQKLDSEIDEQKKLLGDVLKAQKEPPSLLAMRERAETAAANLEKWQTSLKELSLEVRSVTLKAAESETRLYDGTVSNPKELTELQQEVEALGRRKVVLESGILEAETKIEALLKEDTVATDELETAVAQWNEQSAHLKTEQNNLALNLHKLMQARKARAVTIEAPLMSEYEKLRELKNGLAVAGLRVNMCLGCRTTVSANKVKEVQEGQKVYCGGCDRLLIAL